MTKARWFKGSLHAHTTESDGDESPENVAAWFADRGYDWLVISDHNLMTVVEGVDKPLLISGEEVTVELEGQERAVYANAVAISRVVEPVAADGVLATLQTEIDGIVAAGGIASLTAPYFRPGFDPASLRDLQGFKLMEVFNAHPMNVHGDPSTFSYEGIWDTILTAGHDVYGTATDDSHHYGEPNDETASPGRAWVMTRATELSQQAVVDSLVSGDFYGTTGVMLASLERSAEGIALEIDQSGDESYVTSFIARAGTVMAEVAGLMPVYKPRGDEVYVRATVRSSSGQRAWVQPVFIAD